MWYKKSFSVACLSLHWMNCKFSSDWNPWGKSGKVCKALHMGLSGLSANACETCVQPEDKLRGIWSVSSVLVDGRTFMASLGKTKPSSYSWRVWCPKSDHMAKQSEDDFDFGSFGVTQKPCQTWLRRSCLIHDQPPLCDMSLQNSSSHTTARGAGSSNPSSAAAANDSPSTLWRCLILLVSDTI